MRTGANRRLTVAVCFVALSAAYFLVGRRLDTGGAILFKVLPEVLLSAVLCSSAKRSSDPAGLRLAFAALLFSIAGDAFGEFKSGFWGDHAFVLQVAFFAVAQVLYAISFARFVPFGKVGAPRLLFAALLAAYFVAMAVVLLGSIHEPVFKVAVLVYLCLLALMSITAVLQRREGYPCFVTGALLFVISDSMIAVGMFLRTFPHRGLLIMLSYFAAQLLLNIKLIKPYNHD